MTQQRTEAISEIIEMLKNSKEFDFIKDIPSEQLWKLVFVMLLLQESIKEKGEEE